MDLKEIQALHAQYASPTLTIDLAATMADLPALPAPERVGRSKSTGLREIVRYRRHALIAVAVAVLAAGGGASAARIWQVLHRQAAPYADTQQRSGSVANHPQADVEADTNGKKPLNVAPPRPLRSSDFDGGAESQPGGLAAVDPRKIARSLDVAPASMSPRSADGHPSSDNAAAAASPIHAAARQIDTRVSAPASSAAAAPLAGVETPVGVARATQATPQRAPVSAEAETKAAPVATPTAATSTPSATTSTTEKTAPHALRPLHRVTTHRKTAANESGSDQGATPAAAAKAPAGSSDVQLF